jgi:hypothetical protein
MGSRLPKVAWWLEERELSDNPEGAGGGRIEGISTQSPLRLVNTICSN